jgi:hypothetical protein
VIDTPDGPTSPSADDVPATPLRLNAAGVQRPDGTHAIQLTLTLLLEPAAANQFVEIVRQLVTLANTGLTMPSGPLPSAPPANGGLRIVRPGQ